MYRRLFLFILLPGLLTLAPALMAQGQPDLDGPLLGINPAHHDSIILYDITNDTYRTLNFGPGWHFLWDFSPDGCQVLFTLSDDATSPARLYSARIDGRDMRPLVEYNELPDDQWGIWDPDWSPAGDRIAFTIIRDQAVSGGGFEREYHVGWVPPEGGPPEFYSVTGREHEPNWSPTGEWLVYMSFDERAAGADIQSTAVPTVEPPPGTETQPPVLISEADLWVVSGDGETKYRLTAFPTGSVRAPRWSPDGDLVSFIYSPSPNNDTFAMIGAQEGANPTQLNFDWALILDTTWLPDSTHIIGAARDFRDSSENRLWQIPLVGNADENATLYLPQANLFNADYPRFSPNGDWLALRSAYELALVDLSSGESRLLDAMTLGNTPPVWAPAAFETESGCGGVSEQ